MTLIVDLFDVTAGIKVSKFPFSKSKNLSPQNSTTIPPTSPGGTRLTEEVLPDQFTDVLYKNDIEQVNYGVLFGMMHFHKVCCYAVDEKHPILVFCTHISDSRTFKYVCWMGHF